MLVGPGHVAAGPVCAVMARTRGSCGTNWVNEKVTVIPTVVIVVKRFCLNPPHRYSYSLM